MKYTDLQSKNIFRVTILSVVMLFACFGAFAQKGNNQVGIGLDLGLPMGDFGDGSKLGIGGTAKGMYGVGTAGQVELTLGYISFGAKESSSAASASTSIIPIFAGYRHHFNGLYVEPQLGVSMIKTKVDIDMEGMGSFSGSASTSAFGFAVGAGYLFNDFDISARYQSASKNGGSFGFIGLRVGYNFSLGGF